MYKLTSIDYALGVGIFHLLLTSARSAPFLNFVSAQTLKHPVPLLAFVKYPCHPSQLRCCQVGYGVTANIAASHAAARGSIPRIRSNVVRKISFLRHHRSFCLQSQDRFYLFARLGMPSFWPG